VRQVYPRTRLVCPRCRRTLAEHDGRTIYLSVSSYSTNKVVLYCTASGCRGKRTWHPVRHAEPR